MARYFLAPRSGETSYKNFLSTIKYGVPYNNIEPYLTQEGKDILQKQEVIYSWGNREGKRSEWKKIQNGDVVIFYARGYLVMAGKVIYKQHSDDLALAMWPQDENGQPWSYTFFLSQLEYIKIPLKYFNMVSDYKLRMVQGFQEITASHRNKILSHYKTFDDMFREFPDMESVEIPRADERVYINISSQVAPELSTKEVVAYNPSAVVEVGKRKKKSGYVDFDEINKHRVKVGSMGEGVVLRYERERLMSQGRKDLADKVRQLSLEDTYAGYDIISFDEDGREKKIEVKATAAEQAKDFSFHISKNEKHVAENSDNYSIYLVYGVNSEKPKIHIISNPFASSNHLSVEPTNFRVKGQFE